MFSDADLPEPNFIIDVEKPASLVFIDEKDGLFFSDKYTAERRVRSYIYHLLLQAKAYLPEGYFFKIYEAYRPLSFQIDLWKKVVAQQKIEHPELSETSEEFIALCDVFCANPYRQGSGHQSGAAIDVTLCDEFGQDYHMGSFVRDFSSNADFDADVCDEARKNRMILKDALERVGFVNYPAEWWHYSFGDRLWAKLTGSKLAIFGRLDCD